MNGIKVGIISERNYISQLQRIQLGDRTFECDVCGETFYKKCNLSK